MVYEPPLNRTSEIDGLCMEIAELVGARPHVNAGQGRRARNGKVTAPPGSVRRGR